MSEARASQTACWELTMRYSLADSPHKKSKTCPLDFSSVVSSATLISSFGDYLLLAVLTTVPSLPAPGAHWQEGHPLWQPTTPVLRRQGRAGDSSELH